MPQTEKHDPYIHHQNDSFSFMTQITNNSTIQEYHVNQIVRNQTELTGIIF